MNKYKKYFQEILFLTGEDVKKLPFILIIFILASFVEFVGIGVIAPYVSLIIAPETFLQSNIFHYFEKTFQTRDLNEIKVLFGGFLILVFCIKILSAYLINRLILKFSYEKCVKIRQLLLKTYQNLNFLSYLKKNTSSYIYSYLTLSPVFAQSTLQAVLRLASEGLVVIVIFSYLLYQHGKELFVFALLIGAVMFSYDRLFRRKLVQNGRTMDKEVKRMVQKVNEALIGLKEIRILGKEKFFYDDITKSSQISSDVSISSATIQTMPRYLIELVVICFTVSLVFMTIIFKESGVELTAILSVFVVAAMRLIPSVNHILSSVATLSSNRNSVSILYNDIKEINVQSVISKQEELFNIKMPFNSITLDNISFSYSPEDPNAINNISLSIKKGEAIGIIGQSGSGKSTLMDILLGLLTPQNGSIKLNDIELNDRNVASWVKQVAYLPQEIFITDDTIKNNVALGTREEEIDETKVWIALEKSNLSQFVNSLPQKIDTKLGDRGSRLSGGQKQRIAIARGFYYERNVLVMDEATSALDNQTEHEIVEEIKRLKGEKTIIVVAHRLSTLKYCDRIYRLSEGTIVEEGSYSKVVNTEA